MSGFAISLTASTLALRGGIHTAAGPVNTRPCWVLRLKDGQGMEGLGEASPLPAFGGEDAPTCLARLEECLPQLGDLAERLLTYARHEAPLGPLEKILADAPVARACIEMAVLDLKAQRRGQSLADMLWQGQEGWPAPQSLKVAGLVTAGEIAELSAQGAALAAAGYTVAKLKVGGDVGMELARLAALRAALGPNVAIRADANGAWQLHEAVMFCDAAASLGVEYIEQPLKADDLDGLANLRRRGKLPVACDESVRAAGDVGVVASKQAADIVVLKPSLLGGWRPTFQAARLAKSLNIEVVVTTLLDGSIARAFATHIAAALGLSNRAQGLGTGSLIEVDLTTEPLELRGGLVHLRERPGLGVGAPVEVFTIDAEEIEEAGAG